MSIDKSAIHNIVNNIVEEKKVGDSVVITENICVDDNNVFSISKSVMAGTMAIISEIIIIKNTLRGYFVKTQDQEFFVRLSKIV